MGHERLGMLPKTKRWRSIVSEMALSNGDPTSTTQIAANALQALETKYRDLATDESVRTVFSYLVDFARQSGRLLPDDTQPDKSPLSVLQSLATELSHSNGSLEIRELAQRAAGDALAAWYRANAPKQTDLFSADAQISRWQALSTGDGFCELSRLYFSRLTERYLNYFLEREASSVLPDLASRQAFQRSLSEHVSDISRISFESSKITQSFAAGWFNKHALDGDPTLLQKRKFLSYAFEKLHADFRREEKS